jgi:hypothetical protein
MLLFRGPTAASSLPGFRPFVQRLGKFAINGRRLHLMMYDRFGMIGMGHPGMMFILAVIVLVPAWRVCSKAGYSGWLSLFVPVPIANVVFLYFLGFSEWPLERRFSSPAGPTPG